MSPKSNTNPLERIRAIDPERVNIQLKVRNIMLFAGLLMGALLYFLLTIMFGWTFSRSILPALGFGIFMMGFEYLMWRFLTARVARDLENKKL